MSVLKDIRKSVRKEINIFFESEKKFWTDVYEEDEAHWIDKDVSNLTKAAVKKYGDFKNVLEIGCAAGIDTFYLAKHSERIVGIDIVEDVVKIAKKNLKQQPKEIREKIKFEVGDAEKLRFKDAQFDFVYSLSVLHSTNVNKSLKEVRRVLSDEGHAVIYVYVGGDGGDLIADNDKFIGVCEKYFIVEKREAVKIKSDGEDKHKHEALIVYLKTKEK